MFSQKDCVKENHPKGGMNSKMVTPTISKRRLNI